METPAAQGAALMARADGRRWWLGPAAAVSLVAAGAGLGLGGWRSRGISLPPEPPRSAYGSSAGPPRGVAARPLLYSVPVRVAIPAIGVNAQVIPLGENPDGTVAVPSLSAPFVTSWFDEGPSPGQRGPAALFGHVDTAFVGPAVFYDLGDLRPGQTVSVTLADGRIAVFRIDRVAMFSKTAFPTTAVYGATPDPELRLVTCGGPFDELTRSYTDNVVVFARLSATGGS
ncbi:MAG TPA: class F sortase [Streptosporangiaceae bacterium]|nr:class F sortase [Streptosporangiaceae bacterium]